MQAFGSLLFTLFDEDYVGFICFFADFFYISTM